MYTQGSENAYARGLFVVNSGSVDHRTGTFKIRVELS